MTREFEKKPGNNANNFFLISKNLKIVVRKTNMLIVHTKN